MPEIYEAFGYPLTDQSVGAKASRASALCPFMGTDCDGGGNRFQTNIRLATRPQLASSFPDRTEIPAGVCSIVAGEPFPWIVCPRRLLVLARPGSKRAHQGHVENYLVGLTGHPPGTRLGVWKEVKFKLVSGGKFFDYTFDYVAMATDKRSLNQVASECAVGTDEMAAVLGASGYSLTGKSGDRAVLEFPLGAPTLIEIMTSSTSGSSKAKGTTIADSLEKAILGIPHEAPGINKRQVWARMASQLIVKSEVGLKWGGKTLWVLQDNLVQYIAQATGLDLDALRAEETSEVNIVSVGFNGKLMGKAGVHELDQISLFAGPMGTPQSDSPTFVDIVRTPFVPPLSDLLLALAKRGPATESLLV